MSFFSDLFSGNFSNLGNDLAPSNIFKDTVSSFENQPSWAKDLEIAVPAAVAAFTAPEALPALFAGGDVAAGTAVGGFDLATIGPGVDTALADTTLSDTTITDLLSSPGASAFASTADPANTGAFSGAGTAFDMGGGGTLDPAAAAAQGIPTGGAAIPSAPAGPSFAQDLSQSELLAGTGIGGGSPVGAFGAAPGAAPDGSGFLSTLGANTVKALSNPLTDIGLAGLGASLYSGYKENQALNALKQQEAGFAQTAANQSAAAITAAQPLLTSGTALQQYITNGTLPPQFQAQVKQWVDSSKAAVTQGYASRGQSGDPKQNSALQQDLNNIDQQALGLQSQLEEVLATAGQNMVTTANQLLSTGLNATQLAAEIPIQVSKLNMALNAQVSSAIANFAAALNGGNRQNAPGGLNINLNPNTGAIQ